MLGTNVSNIAVAVAIPPSVIAKSVQIIKGSDATVYDELRRILKVKVHSLPQDDYIEVVVVMQGLEALDDQKFPLLLRCDSTETIFSDVSLDLSHRDAVKGASTIQHKSSRIWYRKN